MRRKKKKKNKKFPRRLLTSLTIRHDGRTRGRNEEKTKAQLISGVKSRVINREKEREREVCRRNLARFRGPKKAQSEFPPRHRHGPAIH